jgi:hypothetical protein
MLERLFSVKMRAAVTDSMIQASRKTAEGTGLRRFELVPGLFLLALLMFSGCSNLTGWRIPGIEKSAGPTTTIYLICENAETIPEGIRSYGEIHVDGAFFGLTSNPKYYKYVGNALVVGKVRTEKEREHTVRVAMPGYEPFENTRYYGTLPEYSISFRLKRLGIDDRGQAASQADSPDQSSSGGSNN